MGKYAFCVAGTHSGCGKTTVTLALIASLKQRGLKVQPFKVGPDFIDPGFHSQLAGIESRNLDGWMLTREYNQSLFQEMLGEGDVAVVEGVMGLFDGYDGSSESGSTAEMAKWLGIPVVLIVDARSMARSAAAVVHGFIHFDPEVAIAGVIFNRIAGPGHLEYLRDAIRSNLPGVAILGGLPRETVIEIPERHLGLVTADEVLLGPVWVERAKAIMEKSLDLDLLLHKAALSQEAASPREEAAGSCRTLAKGSQSGEGDRMGLSATCGAGLKEERGSVVIAVARDAAFCFYYPDNLQLLEKAGAQIRFFSPLAGEGIPENAAGVYLGGGYPELYAHGIASNDAFLRSLADAAARGAPIYAECGGLMTLGRCIETADGKRFPMAGLLPFGTRMLKRRKALGYTEVILRDACLLGDPGTAIRGHEFHYSEIVGEEEDGAMRLVYAVQGRRGGAMRLEGYAKGSVLASYVHLHWGSNPLAAVKFVQNCRQSPAH
ncbi:MAG: cobyrinate a,c-diamide synthase [Deltaproteobacteria bacterium]|nr:cobyrinate a,c-diamide synthase [Deltaproteobacteria bacterium]